MLGAGGGLRPSRLGGGNELTDDRVLLFDELTRTALRQLAADALFVWPVGATEQHGPHLPVGTDAFHVERVTQDATAIAARDIPVVLVPLLPFGSSPHHLPFGGTMSLATETYYRVVLELAESLVTGGVRRLFIVNGHGGNHELVQLVARDLALRHDVDVAAGSWWAMAWDSLVEVGAHETGRFPGHSGAFETSLLMAMRPELVTSPLPRRDEPGSTDPRRFGGPYRAERHGFWQRIEGYTDSPALGDADRGRLYLDVAAKSVAEQLVAFWNSTRD
jgi:creatinine amidohydrolase